jgi:DNA mismatch endonuclease (patch repair protein)
VINMGSSVKDARSTHPGYPHPSSAAVTSVMRANRRVDTRPEIELRSKLHRRGLRFRKHASIDAAGLRVRPDIVFPRRRLAVFVDGCFWHGCPDHGTQPRANGKYWSEKFSRNRERDQRVNGHLRNAGWEVLRIWEHVPIDDAAEQVFAALAREGAARGLPA